MGSFGKQLSYLDVDQRPSWAHARASVTGKKCSLTLDTLTTSRRLRRATCHRHSHQRFSSDTQPWPPRDAGPDIFRPLLTTLAVLDVKELVHLSPEADPDAPASQAPNGARLHLRPDWKERPRSKDLIIDPMEPHRRTRSNEFSRRMDLCNLLRK